MLHRHQIYELFDKYWACSNRNMKRKIIEDIFYLLKRERIIMRRKKVLIFKHFSFSYLKNATCRKRFSLETEERWPKFRAQKVICRRSSSSIWVMSLRNKNKKTNVMYKITHQFSCHHHFWHNRSKIGIINKIISW